MWLTENIKNSYNELEQMIKEQNISDDMADALRMLAQETIGTADALKRRYTELCSVQVQIEEAKKNIRTKKEVLQELSGIKTNKQKIEHIEVQTKKKELTMSVHKRMY